MKGDKSHRLILCSAGQIIESLFMHCLTVHDPLLFTCELIQCFVSGASAGLLQTLTNRTDAFTYQHATCLRHFEIDN